MNKEIVIKCCKCTLVLYENELFNGLKPEVLRQALKRGKGYLRAKRVEEYEKAGENVGQADS